MERVLALVRECRVVMHALEHPPKSGESSSAEAERILYFTLMSAIDAGLFRTMEDALGSHASTRANHLGRWVRSGWRGRRGREKRERECLAFPHLLSLILLRGPSREHGAATPRHLICS